MWLTHFIWFGIHTTFGRITFLHARFICDSTLEKNKADGVTYDCSSFSHHLAVLLALYAPGSWVYKYSTPWNHIQNATNHGIYRPQWVSTDRLVDSGDDLRVKRLRSISYPMPICHSAPLYQGLHGRKLKISPKEPNPLHGDLRVSVCDVCDSPH